MAVERIGSIAQDLLRPNRALNAIQSKHPDDIFITLAIRTPLTKAKMGGFKDTSFEYIMYAVLKEVKERSKLQPALLGDICLGNVGPTQISSCTIMILTYELTNAPPNGRGITLSSFACCISYQLPWFDVPEMLHWFRSSHLIPLSAGMYSLVLIWPYKFNRNMLA